MQEAADLKQRLSKAEIDLAETHVTCTQLQEEVASLQGSFSEAQESNMRLTAEQKDLRAQVCLAPTSYTSCHSSGCEWHSCSKGGPPGHIQTFEAPSLESCGHCFH